MPDNYYFPEKRTKSIYRFIQKRTYLINTPNPSINTLVQEKLKIIINHTLLDLIRMKVKLNGFGRYEFPFKSNKTKNNGLSLY